MHQKVNGFFKMLYISTVKSYSVIVIKRNEQLTCNADESQAHNAEQKKSDKNYYTVSNDSYVNSNLF